MKLWDYFRRKSRNPERMAEPPAGVEPGPGGFEFLLKGDVDLPESQFRDIALPGSPGVTEIEREGWTYYKVGDVECTFSIEEPGIQMTFDAKTTLADARAIAEQVLQRFRSSGRDVELVILDNTKVYRSS
ncbi:hypothetical protein [Flaviaesturariibacter amylovorans]|uniref:Uncharacterized protein n=1 Tax=Flaviaesturariibacter amylovorans TaxID=1084520 RepID=A0ABP8HVF2_9BACT